MPSNLPTRLNSIICFQSGWNVAGLYSEDGLCGTYDYDAWGRIIATTGTDVALALNPLRYRGYVYDNETNLYYLQSRYYDPTTGRFLNADDISYSWDKDNVLSCNLFGYCFNNPINMIDVEGRAPCYITNQGDNVEIDGKKMKNISLGFGNIANNGCGVIAAYNVLLSFSSKVKFNNVKNDIIWRGGLNAGGLLGVNPAVLANYMRSKFWFVYTEGPVTYWWGFKAELSDAVIVLFKWSGGLYMHYIAGISTGYGRYGGSFKFYNVGDRDLNLKTMSIWTLIDELQKKVAQCFVLSE